jgi:hypothetical protein
MYVRTWTRARGKRKRERKMKMKRKRRKGTIENRSNDNTESELGRKKYYGTCYAGNI